MIREDGNTQRERNRLQGLFLMSHTQTLGILPHLLGTHLRYFPRGFGQDDNELLATVAAGNV